MQEAAEAEGPPRISQPEDEIERIEESRLGIGEERQSAELEWIPQRNVA